MSAIPLQTLLELVHHDFRSAHPQLSDHAVRNFHFAVRSLERFAGGTLEPANLSESLFDRWYADARRSGSESTARVRRTLILKLWRWLAAAGHCPPLPESLTDVPDAADRYAAMDAAAEGLTLRGLLWERYVPVRRNLKPKSAEQVEFSVRALYRFHDRAVRVDELSEQTIMPFIAHLQDTRSGHTARRSATHLMMLWRFAWRRKLIEVEIPRDYEPPRLLRTIPKAWTLDELGRIFEECLNRPGMIRGTDIRAADFWLSLVTFAYESGARIGAILAVRPEDVDLRESQVVLRADAAKTGVEQLVPINDAARTAIGRILGRDAERVWPWPAAARQLWGDHREILLDAGVIREDEQGVGFHRYRRTCATQSVIAAGWDHARIALGHSQESMTRSYVDLRQVPRPRLHLPMPSIVQTAVRNQPALQFSPQPVALIGESGKSSAIEGADPSRRLCGIDPDEPAEVFGDWQFRRGGFVAFEGRWTQLEKRHALVLRLLVERGPRSSITKRDILAVAGEPPTGNPHRAADAIINSLRRSLRRRYPEFREADPIRVARGGPSHGTGWTLKIDAAPCPLGSLRVTADGFEFEGRFYPAEASPLRDAVEHMLAGELIPKGSGRLATAVRNYLRRVLGLPKSANPIIRHAGIGWGLSLPGQDRAALAFTLTDDGVRIGGRLFRPSPYGQRVLAALRGADAPIGHREICEAVGAAPSHKRARKAVSSLRRWLRGVLSLSCDPIPCGGVHEGGTWSLTLTPPARCG
ncbi:MAG: tyrosine-type recombinase/integrase [Planctomyces sp.]|nr:tyrosine-type recombinase/integrase [Planctomyces sp.]